MQCSTISKTIVHANPIVEKEERNQSKPRQSLSKITPSLACTTRGSNHEGETYSAPDIAGQLPMSLRLKQNKNRKLPPVKCASGEDGGGWKGQKRILWVLLFCARPARDISKSKLKNSAQGNQKVKRWLTRKALPVLNVFLGHSLWPLVLNVDISFIIY